DSTRADAGARGLALRQLLRRFLDVCNTVAYAHDQGIVHRDLKPGNVMLGQFGETLVVDWGLARPIDRDDEAQAGAAVPVEAAIPAAEATPPGQPMGTPEYMSPEQ